MREGGGVEGGGRICRKGGGREEGRELGDHGRK